MPLCSAAVTSSAKRKDEGAPDSRQPGKVAATASRRDRSDEMRALAGVLYRLIREHEIANTTRIKINSTLSRILNHSPEYRRLGRRKQRELRKAKEPAFFTLADIAKELHVPICTLLPTIEHQAITDPQREVMTLYSRWVLGNFAKRADERLAYANDVEDFEAYVTIRKQAYPSAAGQVGTDEQMEPEEVDEVDPRHQRGSLPGHYRTR